MARDRAARPRPYLLWISAAVYAAALLGNVFAGLFVHRAPGYLAHQATILEFYTRHHVSGWATVVCSLIAYFALAGFITGVADTMKGLKGTGRWPSHLLHFLFIVGTLAVMLGYVVCRVGALALGLYNANTPGAHRGLHLENIGVNAGTTVINVGFLVFILAVGLTLIIFARQKNLKLLGALMIVPGAGCVLLLGFGTCLWVAASAAWLGLHELRRLHTLRAARPAPTTVAA